MSKDGGPAFPVAQVEAVHEDHPGMTLRDFYSGLAMVGLIVKWRVDNSFKAEDYDGTAVMSGRFADALLAARGEGKV